MALVDTISYVKLNKFDQILLSNPQYYELTVQSLRFDSEGAGRWYCKTWRMGPFFLNGIIPWVPSKIPRNGLPFPRLVIGWEGRKGRIFPRGKVWPFGGKGSLIRGLVG